MRPYRFGGTPVTEKICIAQPEMVAPKRGEIFGE